MAKVSIRSLWIIAIFAILGLQAGAHGSWLQPGNGFNGNVETMLWIPPSSPLGGWYVAGSFTKSGSSTRNYIAKWDEASETWKSVGSGLNGRVRALAFFKNEIYATGDFTMAGSTPVKKIARFKNGTWRKLGNGLKGKGLSLAVHGNFLYVGGDFTKAGSVDANNFARWGGSAWSALGNGTNGPVYALQSFADRIYLGGDFTMAGNLSVNNIASWGSGGYKRLRETGAPNGVNGTVYALATEFTGNYLYIGGSFDEAGGNPAFNITGWTGSQWNYFGAGTNGTVRALGSYAPNTFVAGGSFTQAGGFDAKRIAFNYLGNWYTVQGMNKPVLMVGAYADQVVAGGAFTMAAGHPVNRIGMLTR